MLTKGMCAEWGQARNPGKRASGRAISTPPLTRRWSTIRSSSAGWGARTPAGRWGKLEELVGVAIFLSSAASDFVNGHVLWWTEG